jgi:hypothetical protein
MRAEIQDTEAGIFLNKVLSLGYLRYNLISLLFARFTVRQHQT